MTLLMIVELLVVLVALWVGARYGSLALGAISGIGLAILVFCFQLKPGTPPTDVIYIIIAAVTCAGMLQASGGMDWMIQIAERLLRKHPERITILAPFTTFFLTILVGTGHVVYTLMPIICDIALKKGIRPERPWTIAIAFFFVSVLINSQGAVVVAMLPLAYSLGIDGWILLGVMPVMKTKRSYSSSAFKMANTFRYTLVHSSCSGVFQECCSGESYSSMSTTTCMPVC